MRSSIASIQTTTWPTTSFKTGAYDFISVYVSHRWVEGTKIDQVDKNWIVKQRVANHNPVGFQGFAFNLRRDKFKDVKVRKAIAMCLNREEFNKTLMFNQYFLHKSSGRISGPHKILARIR